MALTALRLDRVGMNVRDLANAIRFYTQALGFSAPQVTVANNAYAALLGVDSVRTALLQRGSQSIELTECDPPGATYPPASASNDLWFQHCALVTDDIAAAYAQLCAHHHFTPISQAGPQMLPGGIVAFKFRDPDGHPLELIQFPRPDPRTAGGIDHSAISVSDVATSIAFYKTELGLAEQAHQVNTGPAQDRLDGLNGVIVDVVAMTAKASAPHIELLGYRAPRGRAADLHLSDIAATRLVFAVDGTTQTRLLRDPDGHLMVVESEQRQAVLF